MKMWTLGLCEVTVCSLIKAQEWYVSPQCPVLSYCICPCCPVADPQLDSCPLSQMLFCQSPSHSCLFMFYGTCSQLSLMIPFISYLQVRRSSCERSVFLFLFALISVFQRCVQMGFYNLASCFNWNISGNQIFQLLLINTILTSLSPSFLPVSSFLLPPAHLFTLPQLSLHSLTDIFIHLGVKKCWFPPHNNTYSL